MTEQLIKVPDIGGAEGAEVVEVLVAVGDHIDFEQSLIVVESDKASMEIPANLAGTVTDTARRGRRCDLRGDVILGIDVASSVAGEGRGRGRRAARVVERERRNHERVGPGCRGGNRSRRRG